MARYEIFEGNIERLEKHMNKISKKCANIGLPFTYEKVGEVIREWTDKSEVKHHVKYIEVEVSGLALRADWEYVARVTHTKNGNMIKMVNTSISVPERYYTSECYCEHCNTNRLRKETNIIHNVKTNEFMQVGTACVKEYINGLDANAIARWISLFDEIIEGSAPCGSGFEYYYDLSKIISLTSYVVSKYGYVKKYNDNGEYINECTANVVMGYYSAINGGIGSDLDAMREELRKDKFDFNEREESTNAIIEWAKNLEATSEYLNTIKTIALNEYVIGKFIGFAVSIVATYNREMEREARRNAQKESERKGSDYVGNVGDKVSFIATEIKVVTGWETQYGYTYLYKITDTEGNIYTWATSNDSFEGENLTVKGTVKGYKEYNGVKQTVLTRCKVA